MHARQFYSSYEQALDLLGEASHVVVELANSVGIDGYALLHNLPASGTLLTGTQVPVIDRRYRNKCWVLFCIHTTHNVGWPFIRFYTFKHGGVSVDFNGWQWRNAGLIPNPTRHRTNRPTFAASDHYQTTGDDDYRLERFNQLVTTFNDSPRLDALHPWVLSRLGGHADSGVIKRVEVAATADGRIIAPFRSEKNAHTGFHVINTAAQLNNKRHYVRRMGLKQGSYIGIAAVNDNEMLPTGMCEGLATGLSVALVWPGQIQSVKQMSY
jgi:putative DNA primase/helicase